MRLRPPSAINRVCCGNQMLDYIKLKRFKRQRDQFESKNQILIDESEYMGMWDVDKAGEGEREIATEVYWGYSLQIQQLESKLLRRKIKKYNIKIKEGDLDVSHKQSGEQIHYFTDRAMERIKQAIRERKKENRENIEWWVTKVVVPTLGALTGLIGVLLAIWALNRK